MTNPFWRMLKGKPPAVMFGLRLVVVPNPNVPKDHMVFAVHPDQHARIEQEINAAFAKWADKPKPK